MSRARRNKEQAPAANTATQIAEILKKAHEFYNTGRFNDCINRCKMALALDERSTDTLLLLGAAQYALRDMPSAIRTNMKAVQINKDFAEAFGNLGNCYKDSGQFDMAVKFYEKAIEKKRDFAVAHENLANVLLDLGQYPKAIEVYHNAIRYAPRSADIHSNMGNAYKALNDLDRAEAAYKRALEINPNHHHAHNNLGNVYKDRGMVLEAAACYIRSIEIDPEYSAGHSNYASLLKDNGELDKAIYHFRQAIRLNPNFADAWSNMGNTLKDKNLMTEAEAAYREALRINPNFAIAHSNLAAVFKDLIPPRLEEAIEEYRIALGLQPDFPDAYCNLVHSLQMLCDWTNRDEVYKKLVDITMGQLASGAVPSVQPFHALCYPFPPQLLHDICQSYADRVNINIRHLVVSPPFVRPEHPAPGGPRLRIGYVSSDFGNHPLSHLTQSVYGMHNRELIEVFCYSLMPDDETVYRRKIESESEHFTDITDLQSLDAARKINEDGIHILVNLNGFTKGSRNEIFALKPAPVQVMYMGFCNTSCMDFMNYMVTDHVATPPSTRGHFSEQLIFMPHSYFVNDHAQCFADLTINPRVPVDSDVWVPDRASAGLDPNAIVFCNFNQLYKIDPTILECWARILRRVPNSQLWLCRFPEVGEKNIRKEAHALGIPDERVVFADVLAKADYIRRLKLADVFLDTPLCNAHTTGTDVLWGGTPMITVDGGAGKMASHVAASLLTAVGLPELIAPDLAAYEELAVSLALDTDRLAEIKKRLAENVHTMPLFKTQNWVREFETGLSMAYERWKNGIHGDFDVPSCQD
eukprot:gnl/Spiro4/11968_TR6321_c0_g1_i1.p1 gnl/Spiro4/11968_TR6321_c0_g1~~gnl/Spiro4/11968_TR6321_c0_g1_i1.p1  ORF type:complete len:832 (+),score=280.79 gnl/Spiro4/11968_TR6321_c0_g1_i1:69-2498(+)